ncbi:hypothetical protein IKE71_04200 [Candidatus Saccharibacteria bacterium]|nr:hypothetical protein [Candidatus Saccharibacteria bacterium]
MITKEELFSMPRKIEEIRRKKERLERLQDKATSPPSIKSTEKVQTSPSGDSMTEIAVLACDLQAEIEKDEKAFEELKAKAATAYDKVDGINREILILRYCEGESWNEIGKVVGYSGRHVRRIHFNVIRTIYG